MPSPTGPKCVLVVDDDDTIRALVHDVLTLRGYQIDTASDGRMALEKVRTTRPDVIVLDLRMPVMDGWEFLEQCRLDPSCGGMPVVVMSAYLDSPDPAILKVQAVIAKPFDMYVLADTIERVLPPSA
jgi:CheY-like chemotaxis protein